MRQKTQQPLLRHGLHIAPLPRNVAPHLGQPGGGGGSATDAIHKFISSRNSSHSPGGGRKKSRRRRKKNRHRRNKKTPKENLPDAAIESGNTEKDLATTRCGKRRFSYLSNIKILDIFFSNNLYIYIYIYMGTRRRRKTRKKYKRKTKKTRRRRMRHKPLRKTRRKRMRSYRGGLPGDIYQINDGYIGHWTAGAASLLYVGEHW